MFTVLFFVFVLAGTAQSKLKVCKVQINEAGKSFNELVNIKMTKFGKAVITDVPNHRGGKLTAVKHIVLDDVKLEIDIVKQFGDKRTPVCLVHHRTLDEPSERDTENAIKHGGCGKLPSHGSRSNYLYLPRHCDGYLNEQQMEAASELCGDIPMICGEDVEEDDEEMQEKRAIDLALDHMKDERKRAVVREFNACKPESTMVLMQCKPQNLVANCKLTTQFCTYGMTCPLNMQSGHWTCTYNHKFASLKCCDYTCK